jgi:hypothetical protein
MSEAISVQDPRLLVESLIKLGPSHDGAVESDLRRAVARIVAKIESDAKLIAVLQEALDTSARTFGLLALAAKDKGMDALSKIATEYAREAEAALAAANEQTAGEK